MSKVYRAKGPSPEGPPSHDGVMGHILEHCAECIVST